MTPRQLRFLAVTLVLPLAACRPPAQATGAVSSDRTVLTREEVHDARFNSAWDVVSSLRANWLSERGVSSFNRPTDILVYLDGLRFGTVASLREIPVTSIESIRHFNGKDASTRWGLDHGQGVIYVTTTNGVPPTR